MPGHFLIKWQSSTSPFFVDSFNEGQILDEGDCMEFCQRMGQEFRPAYISPGSPRMILLRLCRNLQAIYADSEPDRAEQLDRFVALLATD